MTRGLDHYKKHLAIAAYIALFAIFVVAFAIAHTRYVDHKCSPAPTGDVQGEGNYVIQKTVSLDPHKDPVWISAFDTEMLQLEETHYTHRWTQTWTVEQAGGSGSSHGAVGLEITADP